MDILNAEWYFRIYPMIPWYAHPETWLLIVVGLIISLSGTLIVQYNIRQKLTEITETNEFVRALYDNAPIGINVADENYHFIDFNDYIVGLLGGSEQYYYDFINKFSPEFQPDGKKSEEKSQEILKQTLNGETMVFEWLLKSSNSELIPCEVTALPIKHKGKDLVLSYIYDLRHVREMENKIDNLELKLVESKISIMLSQIKPHFLYNSLLAIRELCLIDPEKASETVDEFSNYLRGNLDSLSINTPIPFIKELKHVQTYLSLEKKRFEDRLNIVYDIMVQDFLIPALTLQQIVENAVRHGITKREEGGTVSIKTEKTDSTVKITVSDNGIGFDVNTLHDNPHQVGIGNAKNRLAAMCNSTLDISSKPGTGTTVTISIPIGKSSPEEAPYECSDR